VAKGQGGMAGVTHEQGGESEHEDAAEYGAKARVGTVGRFDGGEGSEPIGKNEAVGTWKRDKDGG
jgi:hypothetical protein